ncbi:MAG: hypothetical protein KatS3mg035_2010 [Bacteroidia bacterium]|nr:MAG: hypothetical protein KatS3mg035_2010 [Bacteroidia bacterium]
MINEGDINRDDWQNHIFNIDSMKNIPTKICWRRLGMIRHCNGRDVLLVGTNPPSDARTPSNKIVSKIFDGNMLYDGLEYDNNGYYISTDIIKSEYLFSFSPSGKKVLYQIAFYRHWSLYIGDFDRKTGKISNVKDYTYLLKSDLSSGEFRRAIFLNEDEVIITYVGGRLERLEKVYWYKLNLKTMQFDSVGFSVRELALNPNIIDRFGIEDTNNIRFDILSLCPNPNSLPYDQKVFFSVIISHYKRNAEGEYDYLRIRRHFVADIKDFSDVKFESKLIIGQNDSENPIYGVNDWYKILRFTYFSPYLASYIPTELDAGFRYQIGSSCQGNEYNVEFTDTSCCHFYRIWDFGDGTVSDTLWVTQHWEFAGKIDSFRTVSHTYTQPGRYKVKLKILNPYNYGEHLPPGEFVMDSTEQWIEIPPCIEPGIGLRDTLCVFDTLEVIYTGSENVDSLKLMTNRQVNVVKSIEKHSNGRRLRFRRARRFHIELDANKCLL